MSNNIREILTSLGYKLNDRVTEYRTKPIYRDSDNETSLKIDKRTGDWIDFSQGVSGKFEELVRISLNLASIEDAKLFLNNQNYVAVAVDFHEPQIKQLKTFNPELLSGLKPDHRYWVDRGISEEVLKKFGGGVVTDGRMKHRYVFPILNENNKVIGFSGRDLTNKAKAKWLHIGTKTQFVYFMNEDIKYGGNIILVESIGDCLSLWTMGIRNVLVTFGVDLSLPLLNTLLKLSPNKITVSLNNDANNGLIGNQAAYKMEKKLLKYFDRKTIKVKLPSLNDFNVLLLKNREEINQWK